MATIVKKAPGDTEDKLIAKFRKKVLQDQIIPELKDRQYYRPPSVIRKEKIKMLQRQRRTRR